MVGHHVLLTQADSLRQSFKQSHSDGALLEKKIQFNLQLKKNIHI